MPDAKPSGRLLSLEECLSVLSRGARAQLIDLVGDNPEKRLLAMSAFLYFVTKDPRDPPAMARILRAVADQLEAEAKDPASAPAGFADAAAGAPHG